ncbi:hypothetical protein PMI14_04821 [Acidovorax sp. CF316]|uniref:hypothetical protein n=1 Tax=Acidovorax sp. CF316 TaxID=1144317 RepID=UPI00026BE296|nr:hypothetical protein [Acidovorax sp. CF316]EJE50484.1 hypothetical protein PMI14_04821 [Acidovorax sp. CF316]
MSAGSEYLVRPVKELHETSCVRNHSFIEFAGLMNEYITACRAANTKGIDFTQCNVHNGQILPLHPVMSDYINEKLECIFFGAKVLEAGEAA